ncbi:MAG: phosphotransferase [Anaerolineaceae bacterium]|nr:phosphotransferase [Anaerolineaceae bacterium]
MNQYLADWQLSDAQLLTETMTSRIYTVKHGSEQVILKLLAPTETEEQRGAFTLRYFDGHGAVRLLRHDNGAQLLEYADGQELVTLVERGEDENATRIIAGVLNQLHSVPQDKPTDGMFTLDRWFEELFNKAKADKLSGDDSIFVRAAALAERLLADQRDIRVLHGDIHHRNIRQSTRGWLAFDPKGLVGERTYDCANTLCNPGMTELVHNQTRLLTHAGILADELKIDQQRILAFTFAYACLNTSQWLALSGGEMYIDWSLKVAKIIEPHLKGV